MAPAETSARATDDTTRTAEDRTTEPPGQILTTTAAPATARAAKARTTPPATHRPATTARYCSIPSTPADEKPSASAFFVSPCLADDPPVGWVLIDALDDTTSHHHTRVVTPSCVHGS